MVWHHHLSVQHAIVGWRGIYLVVRRVNGNVAMRVWLELAGGGWGRSGLFLGNFQVS